LLIEELCVCDISALINISISAISHQLRLLRSMKIVKNRKQGKMVYYSLTDEHIRKLINIADEHIICVNDPRLMEIDGRCYMTVAVITREGVRGGIWVTDDFSHFEVVQLSLPDNRNFIIFPEKFDNLYVRLERPAGEAASTGDIYISYSPDLIFWGKTELLLEKGTRYWESFKIGPGAPPVKTDKGWLIIYHGCRQHMNGIMYNAGAMLLDLKDPSKIIGKMKEYLMVPEMETMLFLLVHLKLFLVMMVMMLLTLMMVVFIW